MRKKRIKGYWDKRKETFSTGKAAKSRAGTLRLNEQVSHVIVDQVDGVYTVQYSVAKWYVNEMEKAGITL